MIQLFNMLDKAIGVATQAPLEAGVVAPDFTLEDQEGRSVRLYDLRGRPVIIIFYPADDTPGCTSQLSAFNAHLDRLREADGVILGVSPQDAGSHRQFKDKLGLGFDLLVDSGCRIARQWHATLGPTPRIRRTVYAITPGGRVAFSDRGMPPPERVIRALGAWNPPARPKDEGVPVDELLQVGDPRK